MLLGMEESVTRMQRLLDRLKGDTPTTRADGLVDFARLLGDSLRNRFSEDANVRLELESTTALPIAGDPDRLTALSGHLLRNAIDAAGPEGEITVRLERRGESSLFEVRDNGPGMTPEFAHERMTHPFRSSKARGLGIGLYECRQLARELGGRLAIDSAPGRGTVARVWLPLAEVCDVPE